MTIVDVARDQKVDPETVRRWIRTKKLKAHMNSKKAGYKIDENDYIQFKLKREPKKNKKEKSNKDKISIIKRKIDILDDTIDIVEKQLNVLKDNLRLLKECIEDLEME